MKKTLFRQLLLYIMIFGLIIGVSTYIVIEHYFNEYYYDRQQEILTSRSNELLHVYNKDGLEKFLENIETYTVRYNMSVQLFSEDYNILCGPRQGMGRGMISRDLATENINKVFISQSNNFTSLSYLLKTQDESFLLTKISFESMDAAVSLVKNFFMMLAIIIGILFIIFAFIFSRQMSRPLRKLNKIATKMGELDFSMRYENNRIDEIGQLGNTLNTLTKKLESTITQLKNELEKEKTLEKLRKQFTAQVSHEIQTPLTVIKGYAEALSDNILEDSSKDEAYDILRSESEKISKMVDDLLDLSQMESGVYRIRKEEFDLKELLQSICYRYKNLASRYTIDLDIDYNEGKLYNADALRLEQAIDNVLGNAVKYVKPSGTIWVQLKQNDKNITLTIENEGRHIDDSDLPHIFDSYYQGNKAIYGTGLGLSITKHIISLHSGTIKAINTDNGVKIIIQLPN